MSASNLKTALPLLLLGTLASLLGVVMLVRVSRPLGSLILAGGFGLIATGAVLLRQRRKSDARLAPPTPKDP